ncbi:MAG: metal-dependent hydrolase [Burkholderiaceae bacterium]|nr:metal-dependent hydrolase [Burkholderiaceae bacterium]
MTDLVVRRLLIDLEHGFARRWVGGDAFRTALLNALSMSFPAGEQFFIDSVRTGLAALDPVARRVLEPQVRGFIGQEATHRRLHGMFNAELERQGLRNHWQERTRVRIRRLEGLDPRHPLAATAAYEHFTAILADWLHANPRALDGAPDPLATLWLWHAAEESEHKIVAFEVYRALGGDETWRLRWFRIATFNFLLDVTRQTLNNLWHDRALLRPSTWIGGARFLFGRRGMIRACYRPWRAYLASGFHPDQLGDDARIRQWLSDHASAYQVVGATGD